MKDSWSLKKLTTEMEFHRLRRVERKLERSVQFWRGNLGSVGRNFVFGFSPSLTLSNDWKNPDIKVWTSITEVFGG
jgi:site-specific recombinase